MRTGRAGNPRHSHDEGFPWRGGLGGAQEKEETAWPSRMDHGHTGGVSMDAQKPSDSAFVWCAEFGWHVQDQLREALQKSCRRGRKNLALSGHESPLV